VLLVHNSGLYRVMHTEQCRGTAKLYVTYECEISQMFCTLHQQRTEAYSKQADTVVQV
jgi:hypothetical protein